MALTSSHGHSTSSSKWSSAAAENVLWSKPIAISDREAGTSLDFRLATSFKGLAPPGAVKTLRSSTHFGPAAHALGGTPIVRDTRERAATAALWSGRQRATTPAAAKRASVQQRRAKTAGPAATAATSSGRATQGDQNANTGQRVALEQRYPTPYQLQPPSVPPPPSSATEAAGDGTVTTAAYSQQDSVEVRRYSNTVRPTVVCRVCTRRGSESGVTKNLRVRARTIFWCYVRSLTRSTRPTLSLNASTFDTFNV